MVRIISYKQEFPSYTGEREVHMLDWSSQVDVYRMQESLTEHFCFCHHILLPIPRVSTTHCDAAETLQISTRLQPI